MVAASFTALRGQAVRFLLAGAANTTATYVAYLALLRWWDPMVAYATSYAAGVVLSYAINARWVFRGRWTWRGLATFPIVHGSQAVLSFLLFHILVDRLGAPPAFAPLVVIAATVPLTFLIARHVVGKTSAHPERHDRSP